eukprot:2430758-Rhodomonas_salina.1
MGLLIFVIPDEGMRGFTYVKRPQPLRPPLRLTQNGIACAYRFMSWVSRDAGLIAKSYTRGRGFTASQSVLRQAMGVQMAAVLNE